MPARDRSPALQAEYERIGAERLAAQREIDRMYRREFVGVAARCLGWSFAGCFLLLLSFHMTNERLGMIPYTLGYLVGWVGISYTIIAAYLRGIERGDW